MELFQELGKRLGTWNVDIVLERLEYGQDLLASDFLKNCDPGELLFYLQNVLILLDPFQGPVNFRQQGTRLETFWIFVKMEQARLV